MTQFYPSNTDFTAVESRTDDVCAGAWATFKQALHAVIDLDPVRLSMETYNHPVTVLDEAAVNLMNIAWDAAIQAERARVANVGTAIPECLCPRCRGVGRLWGG